MNVSTTFARVWREPGRSVGGGHACYLRQHTAYHVPISNTWESAASSTKLVDAVGKSGKGGWTEGEAGDKPTLDPR